MKKEMKKEMPMKRGNKVMPGFMGNKMMADGGKVMKYADGGMAGGGCGHKGAQDYGKKKAK